MTGEDILNKAEDPAKRSGKSPSSANKTPTSLKAKSEIGKKSSASASKDTNNAKGVMQAQEKKLHKKRKLVLKKRKEIINEVYLENQQTQQEKSDHGGSSLQKEERNKNIDSEKSSKDKKGKESIQQKGEWNKNNDSGKNSKDKKGNEKHKDTRKKDKKKGELGGLIFFCNAKTKPDCFRYQVMGVSMSKKDLVLAVKPGLKLFLYDYDLKLLYGIFRASSSGGVKLEPKAFNGAFPVQVRFEIYEDCHPLPESVFKKAIEENYNSKHKFDTELTVQQVKRLVRVYRPSDLRSSATVGRSPPIQEGVREVGFHPSRDHYLVDNLGDGRRVPVQVHENNQHALYQEAPPLQREKVSSLYPTEREYRAYGLQGERRDPAVLQHVSALESHHRDTAWEHLLRRPGSMHRVTVPAESESINPLYLNRREYQSYTLDGRTELSAYLAPSRREDVSSGNYAAVGGRDSYMEESDPLLRINQMGRLYSTYAANISNHDRLGQHEAVRTDPAASLPILTRYSFPGPSLYR